MKSIFQNWCAISSWQRPTMMSKNWRNYWIPFREPQSRAQVVLSLFQLQATTKKPIRTSDLVKQSRSSRSVIKALLDKNVLEEYLVQTDRVASGEARADIESIQLNELQQSALETIEQGFAGNQPVLLHGVTSSGKTEVYLKLIQDCIEKGKQALYLLPEIALTSQLINRLRNYFGEKVSVYHSKYSVHER